jgi:hypothetical protein
MHTVALARLHAAAYLVHLTKLCTVLPHALPLHPPAFMETLTISAYPDYSFEDRDMAYKLGSAFYGIYFVVSFPMFYRYALAWTILKCMFCRLGD